LLLATLIAATVLAAAIALVVARPAPSLLLPLLLPPLPLPLSLLATLIAVVIALFVASAFTSRHPCCRRATLGGGEEDHTNQVRDPTSAATIGATIIVTTFAAHATGREGLVQHHVGFHAWQTACANVAGLLTAFL
jgi:hypothetical protein